MLVIKAPMLPKEVYDRLLADLTNQAKSGVVLLPPGLELLNEVPADEEIQVVQQIHEGPDVVNVTAQEWQGIMDYFRSLHDCATCKHAPKCTDPDCFFAECTVAGCVCRDCMNGSKWEWRWSHGKD